MHERTQQERRRVANLCVELAFAAQSHIPCEVKQTVRELAAHYRVEVDIEVAAAVVRAFEAGHAWGQHDTRQGSESNAW